MDARLLEWCGRLIGCRSVTGEGTRSIAELCARELLRPNGIEARLLPSRREGGNQVNLLATIGGKERALPSVVLNTHLDTVPPGDAALWTECRGDPFAASVAAGRIYGLGAADTKLDFLAKAAALAQCGRPRRDVYLVGTFGEEHGLVGAKEICEAGLLPRGALAFVGEPSHLEVVTAHKGLAVFELSLSFAPAAMEMPLAARGVVFAGRSAHSSTPALGDNAIRKAVRAVASRPELAVFALSGGDAVNKVPARCEAVVPEDRASALGGALGDRIGQRREHIPREAIAALWQFVTMLEKFAGCTGSEEPDFAPPTLTCNAGVLRTFEGQLTLEFELRPPPALPLDSVREGVGAIVERLSRGSSGVGFALSEKRANPGFRSGAGSEAVEAGMAALACANLPPETSVKVGCTEAGIYAAAGLQPVVFGPGPSTGVIHAPNEYNLISEVEGAIRFYQALLRM
jgi:acetylornithine deacetylase/succinyl-diaminopimelate desuccinylase-like protein